MSEEPLVAKYSVAVFRTWPLIFQYDWDSLVIIMCSISACNDGQASSDANVIDKVKNNHLNCEPFEMPRVYW